MRIRALFAALALLAGGNAWAATERATFAGGCFWCMQPPFDALMGAGGVISTTVGYTGGTVANPTYEQVSHEATGHREAIEVVFDPAKVSYEKLLDVFWHNVDPLDAAGEFCDKGFQYTSAIYYHGEQQKKQAEATRDKMAKKLGKPIVTEIREAAPFYPAEGYHQSYYKKNPLKYKYYRYRCGRDQRLQEVWKSEAPVH